MENFSRDLDDFISQLKTEIDAQQKENLDNFENWFNNKYDKVQEVSSLTYEEVVAATTPQPDEMAVYLAKQGAAQTEGISNAAVGFGVLSMGAVIAGATFFFKKNQIKKGSVDNSSLLEDERFVQV